MITWDSVFAWGRRASDHEVAAPASPPDHYLANAIAEGRIGVQFQPLIEPGSGMVVGAEALARAVFEPNAEALFARARAGRLDERLSRLVQCKALAAAASWSGALEDLSLSINVLPADLAHESYDGWLLAEMANAGIDPARVTVEITESMLLSDHEPVAERLTRLRDAGVRIALDDFGTGYASLSYLTSLPLDMLKIDRRLVANMVGGTRDQIVVKAMIRLARELGLQVLVEGVESTAQLELLCEWGCDLYQGFLGAGALAEDELRRFVTASRAAAAAAA